MSQLESDIDLYDHEVLTIQEIADTLRTKVGSHLNLEGFRQEIINRFGEAGLVTDVRVFEDATGPEPIYSFKIIITDRVEAQGEFDHELQGHEVRANILGKDQPDVQNKTKVSMPGSGKLWVPGKS